MTAGIWLGAVESTLDEMHSRAAEGAPDGTWLVAREQRAGRGSRGRTWHSPPGGLWLSVLRRGQGTPAGFELLSLRVGLAVAEVLDGIPSVPTTMLKWPNDIMVDGRKAGGILVEARWSGGRLQWVAIGIGINVSNTIPPELGDGAVALREFCSETTAEALAEPVARALAGVDLDTPMLADEEMAAYARRDSLVGRAIRSPQTGVACGVGADGRLAIRGPDGVMHQVSMGDVSPA